MYKYELGKERNRERPQPVTVIPIQPKGQPTILPEALDKKLLNYLKALRIKGGVVNIHIVRSVTRALIESNPSCKHLQSFIGPCSWVQSVYHRLGYTRRASTTGRPPVPQGLYDKYRKEFLQDIANKIKDYKIPFQLILNSDQTPSSYVSVGKSAMHKKGSASVPIKGVTNKRAITLNLLLLCLTLFYNANNI